MRRIIVRGILTAVLMLCLSLEASSAIITLINPGAGNNRIQTISGLSITGTSGGALDGMYDATFQHGVDFGSLSGTKITFTNTADALVALNAIEAAVNVFGDVTGSRTDDVRIPTSAFATLINGYSGFNTSANYGSWFDSKTAAGYSPTASLNGFDAWVTFSPVTTAVPEPSSLIVWSLTGLSFAGVGWWRRRRAA